MGKPTGFMEFERVSESYDPVEHRLKHYKEFVHTLNDDEAKVQGARCMDCSIPFCNNGCPAGLCHSRRNRRPARRSPSLVPARQVWLPPSNWRALATM